MRTTPTLLNPLKNLAVMLIASSLFTPIVNAAGPSVSLFPEAVFSEMKQTSETARVMEEGLAPIINRMTNQKTLFEESLCEGDQSGSKGCADILSNISTTYLEMLEHVSESLPDMKRSVNNSEKMLQKRLADRLGRKKTANDIQKELLGTKSRSSTRRHSGKRLSLASNLGKILKVIGSRSGKQSVMSTASLTYLDMRDTSEMIELLEAELTQAKQIARLQASSGVITSEMGDTMDGVVALIMGEEEGGFDDPDVILEPPTANPEVVNDTFSM